MVSPNFGLLGMNAGGFENALAQGMAFGQHIRQQKEEREARNALAEYAANPTQEGVAGIAQYNPDFALQENRRYQQEAQQSETDQRNQLPIMARLLEHATDEATWQQSRALAGRYGFDLSQVPEQFDPAWRNQTLQFVQAMQTPQGQEALSTAGKQAVDMGFQPGTPQFAEAVTRIITAESEKTVSYQPGGGVAGYNPMTGETRDIVSPGPSITSPVPFDENEWEIVEEGTAGNGGGGFPGY